MENGMKQSQIAEREEILSLAARAWRLFLFLSLNVTQTHTFDSELRKPIINFERKISDDKT